MILLKSSNPRYVPPPDADVVELADTRDLKSRAH